MITLMRQTFFFIGFVTLYNIILEIAIDFALFVPDEAQMKRKIGTLGGGDVDIPRLFHE